jgi:hypothetical protein
VAESNGAGPAAAASGNFDGNPAVTADATTAVPVVATSVSGIGVSSTTASPSNAAVHAVNANGVAVEASGVTAVKGTAPAIAGAIGVSGTCPTGSDNFGGSFQGWTGLIANGTQTTLRLSKSAFGPPASTGNAYVQGDITVDSNGDLWYCINGGPPSVWRQIAATNSAGTYHALTPGRVYDSRNPIPDPGPISTGQVRLLSIADRRDLNTGAVVEANFVPVNATAVFANITVDHTVAEGYLTVNPGGVTAVNASTINWGETGETIANGVILTLDNVRRITVIAGGPGSTDFLIDITGYWL